MVQKSRWTRFVTKLLRNLFWNINSRTYPFKFVSYPIIYMVICPQALTCFKVKGLLISADAIEANLIHIHLTYKTQKKSNIAAIFFEDKNHSASYFTARRSLSLFQGCLRQSLNKQHIVIVLNASKEHAVYSVVGFFFPLQYSHIKTYLRSTLFTRTPASFSQRRIYSFKLSDLSRFPYYFDILYVLKVLRTAYCPLPFQIAAHIDNNCPLTLIYCPYSQIGCDTKVNFQ